MILPPFLRHQYLIIIFSPRSNFLELFRNGLLLFSLPASQVVLPTYYRLLLLVIVVYSFNMPAFQFERRQLSFSCMFLTCFVLFLPIIPNQVLVRCQCLIFCITRANIISFFKYFTKFKSAVDQQLNFVAKLSQKFQISYRNTRYSCVR